MSADAASTASGDAARAVLERLYDRFNAADVAGVQSCFHFPIAVLAAQPALLTPEQFGPDFDALRASEDWARTSMDEFTLLGSSATRRYCLVKLSRYDRSGRRYLTGTTMYTVTLVDGRWGIQAVTVEMVASS